MPAIVTLLYPAVAFDLSYYLKSHMPLVAKTWTKYGMGKWSVIELDPKSGYGVQCILEWDSAESFSKAAAEEGDAIMGDIKNYTEGKPLTVVGTVVGSS